jgi:hypothetical protein
VNVLETIAYWLAEIKEKMRDAIIIIFAGFLIISLLLSTAGLSPAGLRGHNTIPSVPAGRAVGRPDSPPGGLILPAPEELQEIINSILKSAGRIPIKIDGKFGPEFRKGYEEAWCIQQGAKYFTTEAPRHKDSKARSCKGK